MSPEQHVQQPPEPAPSQRVLGRCATALTELARCPQPPDRALELFDRLDGGQDGPAVELVWLGDASGWSYQAVILEGEESILLGASAAGTVPMPLRGPGNPPDRVLVEVDGRCLPVNEALALIDLSLGADRIPRLFLDRVVVAAAQKQLGLELTPDRLRQGIETLRRTLGLLTEADVDSFLDEQGLCRADLVGDARRAAILRAVQERVVDPATVTRRYEERPEDFAAAALAVTTLGDRAQAAGVAQRLRAGAMDVDPHRDGEPEGRAGGRSWPLLATYRRWELPTAIGDLVFAASAGAVLDPLEVDGTFLVVRLIRRWPPCLDPGTSSHIEKLLFEEWLTSRRAQLDVQWAWGLRRSD